MPFSHSALSLAFLSWRARQLEHIVQWPEGGTGARLAFRFAEHLSASDRRRHAEDYGIAVSAFSRHNAGLVDWYDAILLPFEENLRFENGAPRLSCGALTPWRALTSRIDPDSLIAFRIAQTMPARTDPMDSVRALHDWGYFIGLGDHGLARVLRGGLADIHVHFEASDPLPLLWLRLATGRVPVRDLQFFSDATLLALERDERAHHDRLADRERLNGAMGFRAELARQVQFDLGVITATSDPGELLMRERALLVSAWRGAFEQRGGTNLLVAIDNYLSAKSLFLRRHQQRAGEGPGLTRFRDYLDRGETLGERKSKRAKPAVRVERFERMLSLATESKALRVVELRIAPQDRLRGWYDFFRAWEAILRVYGPEWHRRGLDVRFVVHFIRKTDRPDRTRGRFDVEFGALRQRLDRQTAVLQLFRHSAPRLAKRIVGIDVANLERACPPEVFAPYLQLLRGRPELAGPFNSSLLDCWRRLSGRNLHLPPPSLPTLGLTYHAGEDFYHPLDGLRAIDGLLENLLRPGDRIGHGLAVGWDVARFDRDRGPAPIPVGVLLDDLIWLRRETAVHGEWTGPCQIDGDNVIAELAAKIYLGPSSRGELERSLAARFRVPRQPREAMGAVGGSVSTNEEGIAARLAFDRNVALERARFAEGKQLKILGLTTPLLPAVQARLATKLRNAGIVIEANPSSNVATGAVNRLNDHPFFSYLKALDGQVIVTINTDDPGVFGTNIEIEFALMFEAMLERNIDRGRALAVLEQSRELALDHVFGECAVGCGKAAEG